MTLRIPIFALAFILSPGLLAQDFSVDKALEHIKVLASKEMEGRQSGLPGAHKAEEYAASRFKSWGLQPAGDKGTYFQNFDMLVTRIKAASLEIMDTPFSPIRLCLHEDFYPLTHSGSGDVTGEAVFVGHGISRPDKGWDDYKDGDIKGKVVIVLRGNPPVPDQDWSEEYSRNYTALEAQKRGAAAILYLQGKNPVRGAAVLEKAYNRNTPMAYIAEHLAEKLFMDSGQTLETYKAKLKEGPCLLYTGFRIHLNFEADLMENGASRNVVAKLEGSDPKLKEEVILLGGHLDHIGVCPGGRAFVGANDNASGSAMVLELARIFAQSENKPKRSLVFALFAAEEQGLLGAEYMAEHPPVDKSKISLMVNYDMQGHGEGKVGLGGSEYFPLVWSAFEKAADPRIYEKIQLTRAWGAGSDHAPFRAKGIPVFCVWSRGKHMFYHTIYDRPEFISLAALKGVGSVSERMIRFFADWDTSFKNEYAQERELLAGSCQVDFMGACDVTRIHSHGGLWNIEEFYSDPITPKALFHCFEKLKTVTPPRTLGANMGDVYKNISSHKYTLLPCITHRMIHCAGENNAYLLKKMGACYALQGELSIITPLADGLKRDRVMLLYRVESENWLKHALEHEEQDPFYILRLGNRLKNFERFIYAVHQLGFNDCHLDLCGYFADDGQTARQNALLELLRKLKESGIDKGALKKLLGHNLMMR